jgi:hypothetical protein
MVAGDGMEHLSRGHQLSSAQGTPSVAKSKHLQPSSEVTGPVCATENSLIDELGGLMIGPQCVGPRLAVALGKRPAN